MKKIVTITILVIGLILVGVTLFISGGKMTNKSGVDLSHYLPNSISASKYFKLGLVDSIDKPNTVLVGAQGSEQNFTLLSSKRGNYESENGSVELNLWAEEVSPDEFGLYLTKAREQYAAFGSSGKQEGMTINDHQVLLSYRSVENITDSQISKMITLGGGYVFFPDSNVVVVFTHLNPKLRNCKDKWDYSSCEFNSKEPILSFEDMKVIASSIIANANTFTPTPKVSDKFLHYKSEKYGVEIDYPKEYWVNDPSPLITTGGITIATVVPWKAPPSHERTEWLNIAYVNIPDNYKNFTAKNIFEDKKKEYSRTLESISNIRDVEEVTIKNEKAAYLVYDTLDTSNQMMLTTKEVGIVHNGKLYILNFTDAKSDYSQSIINADKMIQSFGFSE